MQTSLRSNYQQQYYDYGLLDSNAANHNEQTTQQHQLPEDNVNPIQQHPHYHVQLTSTATSHNHHHHQQHQLLPQNNITFEQQSVEATQPDDTCYTDAQDVAGTSRVTASEQLVVYSQSHHHYQPSLASSDHLNSSSAPTSDIGSGDIEAAGGVENIYHLQQHTSQQQHLQTNTAYHTIYYETLNFGDNCSLEPAQQTTINGESQAQQTFTNHLVHENQFTELQHHHHHHHQQQQQQQSEQQQPPAESVSYFQYLHHPTEELPLTQNLHPESSSLPTTLNHSYVDSQQQTTGEENQTQQVYRTLDVNNQNFEQLANDQISQNDHFCSLVNQPEVHQSRESQFDLCKQDQYHLVATNKDHQLHHSDTQFYLDSGSTGVSIAHSRESHSSAASTSSSEESSASTLTRDEKRAREANIPMTYYEIVNLSIEQFNEQLGKHSLSESQLTLIKDIRRRGKNKVAAQSCRKRKMEQIYELQHEVNHLESKRRSLSYECSQLMKEHGNLVQEYDKIYAIIQERMHYEPMK